MSPVERLSEVAELTREAIFALQVGRTNDAELRL